MCRADKAIAQSSVSASPGVFFQFHFPQLLHKPGDLFPKAGIYAGYFIFTISHSFFKIRVIDIQV